jgi:hypothetical protein
LMDHACIAGIFPRDCKQRLFWSHIAKTYAGATIGCRLEIQLLAKLKVGKIQFLLSAVNIAGLVKPTFVPLLQFAKAFRV